MSLTPQDIQNKQFQVRFRGVDVGEVNGFLEQVAESFLMLIEQNKTIQSKADALEQELAQLKTEEHSFKNAMISAHSIAEGMLKKSREDADHLLAQTHEEIQKHKDDALKEITELEHRVDQLRGTQSKLQKDLHAVIDGYLDMIDNPATALASDGDSIDDQEDVVSRTTSSALSEIDLSDLHKKDEPQAAHPVEHDFSNDTTDESPDTDMDTLEIEAESSEAISDLLDTAMLDLDDEVISALDEPLDDDKADEGKSWP